jgi:cell division protein FtsL
VKRSRVQRVPSMSVAATCLVVIALVIIALAAGHVHRRREAIRLGYQLSEATAELRRAEETNRKLRLERSVLTNPERIRRLAEERGLRQPSAGQVRVVPAPGTQVTARR